MSRSVDILLHLARCTCHPVIITTFYHHQQQQQQHQQHQYTIHYDNTDTMHRFCHEKLEYESLHKYGVDISYFGVFLLQHIKNNHNKFHLSDLIYFYALVLTFCTVLKIASLQN